MTAGVLPADRDKRRFVRDMFDRIAPRYELVNSVMTAGLDRRWRRAAVESLGLPEGSSVADVACGPGEMCRHLTAAGYRPAGVDLSWGMLTAASSPRCAQGDATCLPLREGSVDGVTCAFGLRNFADVRGALEEMARILRTSGRLALLEVSVPSNRLARLGHSVYFNRVVPRIGSVLSDRTAYRYLPQSVAYLPGPEGMVEMLEASGFRGFERRLLGLGAAQLVTATRT